ncbi:MAG: hypothetical protein AAFQ67_04190 [Pseudomonadota bacterium]
MWSRFLSFIERGPVIVATMFAAMVIFAGYFPAAYFLNLRLLELAWDAEQSEQILTTLSAEQYRILYWTTTIIAPSLPLASGLYYAGICTRFAGAWRIWAALPALFAMTLMYLLGAVHLAALNGAPSWLWLKAYLSPLHTFAWAVTILLAYGLWAPEAWRWLKALRDGEDS